MPDPAATRRGDSGMCKGPGAEVPVAPGVPRTECGSVSRVAGLDLGVGAAAQGLVRRLDFITSLMRDGGRL